MRGRDGFDASMSRREYRDLTISELFKHFFHGRVSMYATGSHDITFICGLRDWVGEKER